MRFNLRSLFIVMAIVAAISSIVGWARGLYHVQVRTVNAVLGEYPEIDRVWLGTNDDVVLEVEQLLFSIAGQPELIYGIDGIDGASKWEIRNRLDQALREKRPKQRPDYAEENQWPRRTGLLVGLRMSESVLIALACTALAGIAAILFRQRGKTEPS